MDTCSIEGCDRPLRARGWCISHYNRWLKNGATGPATFALRADHYTGPEHPRWAGVGITYRGAHNRVVSQRGEAKGHLCTGCSKQADTWAYTHSDPSELHDPRGRPYSADPAYYEPMCFSCHTRADHARAKEKAS